MAKDADFVVNVDLHQNELRNAVVQVAESEPTTGGRSGQIVSYAGYLYISDGTEYAKLGQAGAADDLQSEINAINTILGSDASTGLRGQVAKNTTDISNNASSISAVDVRVGKLETALGSTEGSTGIIDQVETNKTNIGTLSGKVTTLEGEMDTAQADILALQEADNTFAKADEVYTKGQVDAAVKVATDASATNATKIDALEKAGYITNAVDDLVNYYKKTETYTQTEINGLISAIKQFNVELVDSLPATGVANTIYFVPNSGAGQNVKDEYIYIGGKFELIGTTQFQLSISQTTSGISINGTPLQTASSAQPGILSAADWTTFNAKQPAGDYVLTSKLNEELVKKQDNITGAASTVVAADLTASMAVVTDASGKLAASAVPAEKVGYLSDVTSNIQAQINKKATAVATGAGEHAVVTVNAEGIVTEGRNLTAADIPALTVSKISDFDTEIRAKYRKTYSTTAGETVSFEHNLNIEYPQVTVYGASGQIIYADVTVDNANKVTVSGNAALGAITIVVSI